MILHKNMTMSEEIVVTLRVNKEITQKKINKINAIQKNLKKVLGLNHEISEDLHWLIVNYRISLYKEQIKTKKQIEFITKTDEPD